MNIIPWPSIILTLLLVVSILVITYIFVQRRGKPDENYTHRCFLRFLKSDIKGAHTVTHEVDIAADSKEDLESAYNTVSKKGYIK